MAVTAQSVAELCRLARDASRTLATLDSDTKNAALRAIADALEALRDRLALDATRIRGIADGVRSIANLPDPVGEVIDGFRLPNGLDVRKVRVPLGVVAVVYEARPKVTIDAAALCLKSGNAILLRGSSSAAHSNAVLAAVAAEQAPAGAIQMVEGGRDALADLARQEGLVDLIIPRGGEGLKAALREVATVPVIYAESGKCHVF